MKQSRYEQETIVSYNAGEQTATIYTRDKAVMRKLDTLVADFCFLSSTFPEKKRQNSLFLARDFLCFRQDVLCILTHEGMFHPVAFSLKDQ